MPFDLENIRAAEFGVCLETGAGESCRIVPSEQGVQDALKEMLAKTIAFFPQNRSRIPEFSPAEKYAATEALRLSLTSDWAQKHRIVFAAENLDTDTHALESPAIIISYLAVFRDHGGGKLMAFRRATQFKGVVKKHLLTFYNDALRIVPDSLFKLDTDFDFLIFDDQILIWRPSGFIFTADMDAHIAACAAENVDKISEDMTCIDFGGLRDYVTQHKLAMRLVAALKSRTDLADISLRLMKASCRSNKIEFTMRHGKLVPSEGTEMDFPLLLDRRLYTLTLIPEHPETYQASSRSPATRDAAAGP